MLAVADENTATPGPARHVARAGHDVNGGWFDLIPVEQLARDRQRGSCSGQAGGVAALLRRRAPNASGNVTSAVSR